MCSHAEEAVCGDWKMKRGVLAGLALGTMASFAYADSSGTNTSSPVWVTEQQLDSVTAGVTVVLKEPKEYFSMVPMWRDLSAWRDLSRYSVTGPDSTFDGLELGIPGLELGIPGGLLEIEVSQRQVTF
jgi:hypothetical protein